MSGPHPERPESPSSEPRRDQHGQPETAPAGVPVSGFPEPPGKDPGDRSGDRTPHSSLNTPVGDPDPTEWPDPYDRREDPRAPADGMVFPGDGTAHTPVGATSNSEPHSADDIAAVDSDAPEGDDLDA
jgi:hypothetical protein